MLLTNTPELFKKCGVYNPEISDHHLIYVEMTEKVCQYKTRIITFRRTKNRDLELLYQELINTPWYVSDIFTFIDVEYDYWRGLFESVVNKYVPVKRKKVKEQDIPYMTRVWKNALRKERKYTGKFPKYCMAENLELANSRGSTET